MASLHWRREGNQRDITRLLDGFTQPPLVRRAYARDPPRRDLAALGDEGREHSHVLVIDVVDFFHAEPAHFLAPEILLLGGHRLVAAGGPLRCADGTSASRFSHDLFLLSR